MEVPIRPYAWRDAVAELQPFVEIVVALPIFMAALLGPGRAHAGPGFNVTTYHYDNQRTGWNSHESKLTPTTVRNGSFGPLYSVTLDGTVWAQPLVVTNQAIQGVSGNHDVVYVVTAKNTIYAIDSATGKILLQRNFGAAVPAAASGEITGTNGTKETPVIDLASGTLYVAIIPYLTGHVDNATFWLSTPGEPTWPLKSVFTR